VQEAGVPGYEVTTWYGIFAPAGTPPEIVAKLQQEVAKAMQRPEIRDIWEKQGAGLGGNSSKDFADFVKVEVVKWGKVAKDANIKVE
jgi:tripartite-type tricarboxylate transporter receptor subunit TctC